MLVVQDPDLATTPALAMADLWIIVGSPFVQFAVPRAGWLVLEESLAGIAAMLIIGLGPERVTILSLLGWPAWPAGCSLAVDACSGSGVP